MSNRICSGKPQQQTLGISEIEDKAVETSQPKKQQKTKKKKFKKLKTMLKIFWSNIK